MVQRQKSAPQATRETTTTWKFARAGMRVTLHKPTMELEEICKEATIENPDLKEIRHFPSS